MPVNEVVHMADQAAATVGVTPSRRHKALPLAALSLAAFAYVSTESLPIGLLVPMSHALRAQEPAIGFLVTAYGGIVLVASVPLTLLTQHLPRRLVLCCVLAAFVVTSLSSAAELPADEEGGRAMARTLGHPGEGQAGRPDLLLDVLVHRPKLCKPAGTIADGLSQKKGGPSLSPGGDVAMSGVTGIARRRTLR